MISKLVMPREGGASSNRQASELARRLLDHPLSRMMTATMSYGE